MGKDYGSTDQIFVKHGSMDITVHKDQLMRIEGKLFTSSPITTKEALSYIISKCFDKAQILDDEACDHKRWVETSALLLYCLVGTDPALANNWPEHCLSPLPTKIHHKWTTWSKKKNNPIDALKYESVLLKLTNQSSFNIITQELGLDPHKRNKRPEKAATKVTKN